MIFLLLNFIIIRHGAIIQRIHINSMMIPSFIAQGSILINKYGCHRYLLPMGFIQWRGRKQRAVLPLLSEQGSQHIGMDIKLLSVINQQV